MFDNCLTKPVKYKAVKQILIIRQNMKEQRITVREFLRNYKKMINKDTTLIILNNGKEQGVYIPYKKWKEDKETSEDISGKTLLEAIKPFMFETNDPNLSQKVDEIVYGTPNPYRNDTN